jgi:hypothetical protein
MELDLTPLSLPTKTPVDKNRKVIRCCLTFEDGTELELEVPEDQGVYTITEYKTNNSKLTIHEVFITHGNT